MKRPLSLAIIFLALISLFATLSSSCSKKEVAQGGLDVVIQIAKSDLPKDLGDGMVVTDIQRNGDYLTYVITTDESEVSILEMQSVPGVESAMKQVFTAQFKNTTDENIRNLIKLLRENNMGIQMKFEGTKTGQNLTITIEKDEL